jgi:Asp-tRNA(Asn)/Glu-tRNA(Gln) amidotransferase B subunit
MKAYNLRVRQDPAMRAEQGKRAHLQFVGPRLPRVKWEPDVVKRLLEEYPCTPNKVLAEKYGVSTRAVCQLANRHNVMKSKEYISATCAENTRNRYRKN